jgi:hypothetical protein
MPEKLSTKIITLLSVPLALGLQGCPKEEVLSTNMNNQFDCDKTTHWQVEVENSKGKVDRTCEQRKGWDNSFLLKLRDDVVSANASTILPANTAEVSGFFKNGDGTAYAKVSGSNLELTKADGAWRNYTVNNTKPVEVTIGTKFDQTHKWGDSQIGGNFKPKNF